jgi:hypothetical protein
MFEPWVEDYLMLALRTNRVVEVATDHATSLISYYYGPPAWQAAVAAEALAAPRALLATTVALADALPTTSIAAPRQRWLGKQLLALETVCRRLDGEVFSLTHEVQQCYDLATTWFPETVLNDAWATLDVTLPGSGTLTERLAHWDHLHRLPSALPVPCAWIIEHMVAEIRQRTLQLVPLPPTEQITLRIRDDLSFNAMIGYQGGYRSHGDINPLVVTNLYQLMDTLCHEAYPGHHTTFVRKEYDVYVAQGGGEQAVWIQNSPQTSCAEMIAQTARTTLFAPGEMTAWLAEHIFPQLGLPPDTVDADRILEARALLQGAWCNAALMVRSGQPDAAVAAYLARYLQPADVAYLKIPFIDSDLMAYTWSWYRLHTAFQGADRTALVCRLINELLVPSDLW